MIRIGRFIISPTEGKVTKMMDERLFGLKLDLAKEKKMREEAEDRHYKNFGE